MKKSQIILFSVTLVLTGIIYAIVLNNKKTEIKEVKGEETVKYIPVQVVKNENRSLKTKSYGQVTPYTELDVAFEVQGKLEKGAIKLKPGSKFRFNDLLYKVDSEEMFFTLSARKAQLSNLLINLLADIELDFPEEFEKWNSFIEKIDPVSFLPEFPQCNSDKEKMFFTAKGVFSEYLNIKSLETRMSKYLFLAPFNGYVVDTYAEPGSIINPGVRIARIANMESMEVKLPIAIDLYEKFKEKGSVQFRNAENVPIGSGKIIRTSNAINQSTQSIDVYYSIEPLKGVAILSNQYVTAEIDNLISESMCVVPSSAVKENAIYLLRNEKLIQQKISVIGSKQDSLFIHGLNDNDTLLLEYNVPNNKIKKYIGIERQ